MLIRKARETDVTALKRLLSQLGYSNLDEQILPKKISLFQTDGYALLVGEINLEIVGFIALHWFELLHINGKMGRISAFCVDERFRSQGIGIKLLTEAETLFTRNGCAKIEVTSNAARTTTHRFYLNRNYIEDSKRFVKYIGH